MTNITSRAFGSNDGNTAHDNGGRLFIAQSQTLVGVGTNIAMILRGRANASIQVPRSCPRMATGRAPAPNGFR